MPSAIQKLLMALGTVAHCGCDISQSAIAIWYDPWKIVLISGRGSPPASQITQ
jgi:hypothetical protein